MVDRLTPQRRSWLMSRVGAKNTGPEMNVRKALHGLGYRYRLHRKDLPGSPDLVLPSRHKVIFVHGCFWHGHGCRGNGADAKSNVQYWSKKIETNRKRDRRNRLALRKFGWEAIVVWECELKKSDWAERILRFLGPARSS